MRAFIQAVARTVPRPSVKPELVTVFLGMCIIWLVLAAPASAVVLMPGDLIVADVNGARGGSSGTSPAGSGLIFRVNPTTGAQTLIASGGNLDVPCRVTLDGSGNIIVVDQSYGTGYAAQVIRINPADGAQQVISSGNLLTAPTGVCVDAAGDILVSDATLNTNGGILRINPTTGVQTVLSSGNYFHGVSDLTMDAAGYLYAPTGRGPGLEGLVVLKIDPVTGTQSVVSSGTSQTWFSGIAIADTGNIFVSEIYFNDGIIKIDASTHAQSFLTQGGYFSDPWGLTMDLAGQIVVADSGWYSPGRIIRVNPTTGVQTLLSSGGSLVDPYDIAVAPIPEPSTLALVLVGVIGLTAYTRDRFSVACRRPRRRRS